MAEKITYILGAGASIGAFPLVKGSTNWGHVGLADHLAMEGKRVRDVLNHTGDNAQTKNQIADAMIETGTQAKIFGNVDTYAKYLYHRGEEVKLQNLKIALTYYFAYKQICKGQEHSENRYINFTTSLINDINQFPNHVKILSWNYDYLLETANALYSTESFSEGVKVAVHSPAFASYFPQVGYAFNQTHEKTVEKHFSIVHLNGIAGFYAGLNATDNYVFRSIFNELTGNKVDNKIEEKDLIEAFHKRYINNHQLISFAWEKNSETKDFLVNVEKIAQEIIKDTTILVVIGYSFPFYNREMDNAIFETITPSLKKIYFQDPNNDGEFLRKRYDLGYPIEQEPYQEIQIGSHVDIEHITDTDQFYIPIEV